MQRRYAGLVAVLVCLLVASPALADTIYLPITTNAPTTPTATSESTATLGVTVTPTLPIPTMQASPAPPAPTVTSNSTATLGVTVTPTLPIPTMQASPTIVATVKVLSQRTYVANGTPYIVGEIINELTIPVYRVLLTATLQGTNGKRATSQVYAVLNKTLPNQKNPFVFRIFEVPEIATYTLSLTFATTPPTTEYGAFVVTTQNEQADHSFLGTVRNDAGVPLGSANVAVTYYNAMGQVVDASFGFGNAGSAVPSGATQSYFTLAPASSGLLFMSVLIQAEGYQTEIVPTATRGPNCSSAYPTVCIPPPPPDLNCNDISFRNFTVLPADPHHFDTDNDGIGCEQN